MLTTVPRLQQRTVSTSNGCFADRSQTSSLFNSFITEKSRQLFSLRGSLLLNVTWQSSPLPSFRALIVGSARQQLTICLSLSHFFSYSVKKTWRYLHFCSRRRERRKDVVFATRIFASGGALKVVTTACLSRSCQFPTRTCKYYSTRSCAPNSTTLTDQVSRLDF